MFFGPDAPETPIRQVQNTYSTVGASKSDERGVRAERCKRLTSTIYVADNFTLFVLLLATGNTRQTSLSASQFNASLNSEDYERKHIPILNPEYP